MDQLKKIALSPACNPRRFVRDTVRFLLEQPGRIAIASGPPCSKKTEFAVRCAYHLASRQRVLFLSSEMYPDALVRKMLVWYDSEQVRRRELFVSPAFGWSFNGVCAVIAERQWPIVVIDCLNLMDVELCDLVKLAKDANVSVLATHVIT